MNNTGHRTHTGNDATPETKISDQNGLQLLDPMLHFLALSATVH